MNEWKATKVHMHAQCFKISFPAWEDLLKFDTTAWNSNRSIYCASAKVDPQRLHGAMYTFAINELDLCWHRILQWPN